MSNIFETFLKLQFSGLKNLLLGQHWEAQTSGSKTVSGCSIILILKEVMTF